MKFPYPRVIDEPNMYDSIVVQAESMAAEDFTWGPDFSVCILELGNIDYFFVKNILFLNENEKLNLLSLQQQQKTKQKQKTKPKQVQIWVYWP